MLLLLLLLSCFSRVWLCATPQTAAHQAPPSLGFSRQEHWSGLPFPSPVHESEKWKRSRSVMSDLPDPMDCSLPASSIHGIFQARVLEWVAIAFSASTYEADAVIIFILKAEKNEALINLLKVTSQVAASGFKPRSSTVEPVLLTIGVLA